MSVMIDISHKPLPHYPSAAVLTIVLALVIVLQPQKATAHCSSQTSTALVSPVVNATAENGNTVGNGDGRIPVSGKIRSPFHYCHVFALFEIAYCNPTCSANDLVYLTFCCDRTWDAADNAQNRPFLTPLSHGGTFSGLNPNPAYCYIVNFYVAYYTNHKNPGFKHHSWSTGDLSNQVCGP